MGFLWSSTFFCFLLPCLLPWVHLAEEEKKMSISVELSEVPRLLQLLLSLNLFDQEAEAKETEQLNPDVVSSLKKEITANWSQPRLQKVLFQYILYTIYYILYSSHSMRLRLSTQSLNAHINLTRCGRGWLRGLKGGWRRSRRREPTSFLSPVSGQDENPDCQDVLS